MNQVLDVIWNGQIIARRVREHKMQWYFQIYMHKPKKSSILCNIHDQTQECLSFSTKAVLIAYILFAYQSKN